MEMNVLVADDHGIVRMGMSLLIKGIRPQANIMSTGDYKGVIELVKANSFDLIILDINMPNGHFQTTIEFIKRKLPQVKVLVFSSLDDQLYAIRLMQQGADGFLNKLAPEAEVEKAIYTIMETGTYLSSEVKNMLVRNTIKKENPFQNPLTLLSNREADIANLMVNGCSVKEIAEKLHIHISTVSTYKTRIYKKTKTRSLPELIELLRMYQEH